MGGPSIFRKTRLWDQNSPRQAAGAALGLRTGGQFGRTMCHVLVFLAPGPKLGAQNRRMVVLNTALNDAPRLAWWVLVPQTGFFKKAGFEEDLQSSEKPVCGAKTHHAKRRGSLRAHLAQPCADSGLPTWDLAPEPM